MIEKFGTLKITCPMKAVIILNRDKLCIRNEKVIEIRLQLLEIAIRLNKF